MADWKTQIDSRLGWVKDRFIACSITDWSYIDMMWADSAGFRL